MPNYLRNYEAGGTYFFTLVTQDRRPILTSKTARTCLRTAIREELERAPFKQVAIVLLPDHLHAIWTLPGGDAAYSIRWKRIKERFTRAYLSVGGREAKLTANRRRHQERGIWQPRFWEHTIRDDDDFERCVNYLHYNPVKHKLVSRVCDYRWSTFHDFVQNGIYARDWGTSACDLEIVGAEWD